MGPLLAALFVSTVEAGGSFGIAPLVVNLDVRRAQDVLEVSNSGTEPMLMQADALDWSQRTGQDQLTPSQNLLVSPPVFEVPPGGKQVLRVALLNPTVLQDGVEHAYRVQLREIPATSEDGAVHSSLGVRIPVFFASGSGEAQLRWSRATVNGAARRTCSKSAIPAPSRC